MIVVSADPVFGSDKFPLLQESLKEREKMESFRSGKRQTVFMGFKEIEDGPIVAIAGIEAWGDNLLAVGPLEVSPEKREQGIGTKIMHILNVYAQTKKYTELILTCSEEYLPFYEKMGFSFRNHRYEGDQTLFSLGKLVN